MENEIDEKRMAEEENLSAVRRGVSGAQTELRAFRDEIDQAKTELQSIQGSIQEIFTQ